MSEISSNFAFESKNLIPSENLLVVAGNAETKALKDMMPDILKQVGPQQYQFLKSQLGNLDGKADAEADDDDVPNLVGTFEDAGKK